MSSELGSNNTNEALSGQDQYSSEGTTPVASSENSVREIGDLKKYSIPAYLLDDDSTEEESLVNESASGSTAPNSSGFYAPRPALSRGFNATAYPVPSGPFVNQSPPQHGISSAPAESQPAPKSSKWSWLLPGQRKNQPLSQPNSSLVQPTGQPDRSPTAPPNWPYATAGGAVPVIDPQTGLETVGLPAPVEEPKIWDKQPYRAIAHISALAGTLVAAWLLGILAARIVPGSINRPPLQESLLRKSSRLASGLWHLPQLWRTSTAETRIEPIPLPETGLILDTVALSPIERQPLIDELNAVETELLTLDRRIQSIEKQLGKPPYQGAGIEPRLDGLREAIDPSARTEAKPNYEPTAKDPQAALLAVAEHKITLPSDALFAPGDSTLKDSELLNQVLDLLVNYPGATVVICSYSDDQDKATAARKYTLAQAAKLSDFLTRSLPADYRWVTIGGGHSQPIKPNDSEPNRQRNRRIEILIDTR